MITLFVMAALTADPVIEPWDFEARLAKPAAKVLCPHGADCPCGAACACGAACTCDRSKPFIKANPTPEPIPVRQVYYQPQPMFSFAACSGGR